MHGEVQRRREWHGCIGRELLWNLCFSACILEGSIVKAPWTTSSELRRKSSQGSARREL